MDTSREAELIGILKGAGWVTAWRLYELAPRDSLPNIRKTLRILYAAGVVECRKPVENKLELEWRWNQETT